MSSSHRAASFDIPAVFITASDDSGLDAAVVDAQGIALLRKPFTNDQLLKAVSEAIGRKQRAGDERKTPS